MVDSDAEALEEMVQATGRRKLSHMESWQSWLNALVLKTSDGKTSESSNLSLSAIAERLLKGLIYWIYRLYLNYML